MPSLSALRCIACGSSGLEHSHPESSGHETGPILLDCPRCHRSYPIVAGVPVMFSDAVEQRGPLLAPAVVRTVLRSMGLPADPGNALRLRRASGARASFGDRLVTAESAQFLRRVHASGYVIPAELLEPPGADLADGEAPAPVGEHEPRCRWVIDYIPRGMRPGHACLANVRFENTGAAPMRSSGHGRITIAFTWSNAAGDPVRSDDYRTPLPVDLPPGQAITLPVRVIPPTQPGRYTMLLRMVMEGVRWLEPGLGPLRITVRDDMGFQAPPHWAVSTQSPGDYNTDHRRGVDLLRTWLERQPGPRPLRMLEIGGNATPVLAHLPSEAYNVDVDLLGLQVGWVAERARRQASDRALWNPVQFVCADAYSLPFAEGFFDAIVMFASLHHFPDPAALLRRLRLHLRPGGFIGIFCEPIGHIWPGAVDDAFTDELRHGVNEQGFSLAEYELIFASAGLWPADLVADGHSLKARLTLAVDHEAAHG